MVTLQNPLVSNTKLVSTLPILKKPGPADYKVVFSVKVSGLAPEDVVLVKVQQEFTNPTSYTLELASCIIRADSPTATQGVFVSRFLTGSVPTTLHHYIATPVGIDTGMPAGDYYYNFVAFAKASKPASGDTVTVENSGDLTVLVFDRP